VVEVLQYQRHGLPFAETFEQSEDGLEHASLTPFGGGDPRPLRQKLKFRKAWFDAGHEPRERVAGGADQRGERLVGQRSQQMLQRGGHRSVWDAGRGRRGHTMDGREGLCQRTQAPACLAQEAAQAEARGSREDKRARLAVGRTLKRHGNSFELALTTYKTVAPKAPVRRPAVVDAAQAASVVSCRHTSRGPRTGAAQGNAV